MSNPPLLALFLWGTIAGLDIASILQGLINRPLVAGAVAGTMLGDVAGGLRIGAALELFALDVLPVGASRYPDYGAATVAAVALGAGRPWTTALGPAVLLGLVIAYAGGWSIVLARRVTARVLRRVATRVDRGEPGVAQRVHLIGLLTDVARCALLAAGGLGAVFLLNRGPVLDGGTARALGLVVIAGGFMALIGGALRRAGSARRIAWLTGGVVLGVLGLTIR